MRKEWNHGLRIAFVLLLFAFSIPESFSQTANSSGHTEPLIVDLDGDGISLTPPNFGVMFDLDVLGTSPQIAWTAGEANDPFLAIDLDRNGLITSGMELIDGASPGPNGFATLRSLHGPVKLQPDGSIEHPTDGRLDAHDAAYHRLLLWADRNHNGVSEEPELRSLDNAGVIAISLGYKGVQRTDPLSGSVITFEGSCLIKNQRGVEVPRSILAVRLAAR